MEPMTALESPLTNLADLSANPTIRGVVKVLEGPYNLNKSDVEQFFGAKANILPKGIGESVHIIMDRVTGKNYEVFVEFLTPQDAIRVVERMKQISKTSTLRLGNRVVIVELSNQDELLSRFFSKAKNITWVDGIPTFTKDQSKMTIGIFRGFVSAEELGNLIRAASGEDRERLTVSHVDLLSHSLTDWHRTGLHAISPRSCLPEHDKSCLEGLL